MARERKGFLRYSPTKKTWLARIPVHVVKEGVRIRKKVLVDLGTNDEAVAREKLKREVAKSLVGEEPTQESARAALTVADYAERWLQRREALGIAAVGYERRYLERVWLPAIGTTPLDKVGKARIRDVLHEALVGKIMPRPRRPGDEPKRYGLQSIKHMRSTLVRLLQSAWDDELVPDNKAARVKLPDAEEDGRPRMILTDDEIAALVRHPYVDAEIKVLVLVSRTIGGLRAGDLNGLQWTAFSPGFMTCTFVRRKTRKKRPEPETHNVPEVVRRFLVAWWERQQRPTTGPVFPVRRGERAGKAKKKGASMGYATRLRRELLIAGVDRYELHFDTDTTRRVDFHSTRRAFATALVAAGMTEQQIMDRGGWSDSRMVRRYKDKQGIKVLHADAVPDLDADWTKTVAIRPKPRRSKVEDPAVFLERDTRFERATPSLGSSCSTN